MCWIDTMMCVYQLMMGSINSKVGSKSGSKIEVKGGVKKGVKWGVKRGVKWDNTVDDQAFVLFNFHFNVSPLDFLNLFNSILFNLML